MGGGWAGMGSASLTRLARGRFQFMASRKRGGYFRNEIDHRDFVCIGCAAGMPCLCESICAKLGVSRAGSLQQRWEQLLCDQQPACWV